MSDDLEIGGGGGGISHVRMTDTVQFSVAQSKSS